MVKGGTSEGHGASATSHLRWPSACAHGISWLYGQASNFSRSVRRRLLGSVTDTHFRHVIKLASEEEFRYPLAAHEASSDPTLSFVVPVFNSKQEYLDDLLASFRMQSAGYCQLIFS